MFILFETIAEPYKRLTILLAFGIYQLLGMTNKFLGSRSHETGAMKTNIIVRLRNLLVKPGFKREEDLKTVVC